MKKVLTKKWFLIAVFVFVCSSCVWFFTQFGKADIQHVILISMDTTRWDALSCYEGNFPAPAKTPVIDAFAAEGILFEETISPLPFTLPAHSSMLTGKIPPDHKVLDNLYYMLEDEQVTLAERLRAHGFKTAGFVSSYVLDSQFGMGQGFDHYDDDLGEQKTMGDEGINERRGDETTAKAIQWLGEHTDEKSFVFLHYYDPHIEYAPPEPFASEYKQLFPGLRPELQAYAGEVAFVDHCIGRLIEALKELGIYENALVCITADHGESHGEHKETSHGYYAYNATTRVPMIFRIPSVKEPLRVDEPVGIVDIVPTICSALKIPIAEAIQGRDLTPYWTEKKDPYPERPIFTQANLAMKYGGNSLLGIIAGEYKYIQTTRPELYHLAEDPEELHDLCADQPQRARILQDRLRQLLDDIAADEQGGTVELDPETIRRLESLGYTGASKGMEGAFAFDQSKKDPKDLIDYHLLIDMIRAYGRIKDFEKSIALCQKYITMRPDLYIGYFAMAEVLRDSGQYFEAIGYLKKTVAVDPAHEPAYLELVKINQRLGNFEAVRENAVKLLEINSNNLAAYHYLALSNFERGIYELPGTYLTEEMKNNPFYPKMAVSLADILLKKRQFKKAYDLYRENIERETDSEYLLNTLAWMAATSSVEGVYNPKESLVYALEVCERDGYQQPELLDTLAAAYAANGDFSQAAETAQKAVEVATQDGNNALARQIQSRLRLFQSGKQYYDPGLRQ